jgi:hypothetical protein
MGAYSGSGRRGILCNLGVFGSREILLLLLRHLNMIVEKRQARMMGGVERWR